MKTKIIVGIFFISFLSGYSSAQDLIYWGEVKIGEDKTFYPNITNSNRGIFRDGYSTRFLIQRGKKDSGTAIVTCKYNYDLTAQFKGLGHIITWFEITVNDHESYNMEQIGTVNGVYNKNKKGVTYMINLYNFKDQDICNVCHEIGGDYGLASGGVAFTEAIVTLEYIKVEWLICQYKSWDDAEYDPTYNEIGVPAYVPMFKWTNIGKDVVYDVYIGTASTNMKLVQSDIPINSCMMDMLLPETVYYWRVCAKVMGRRGKILTKSRLLKFKTGKD